MYTVLSNLEATVLKWEDEGKISEYDVLEFRSDLPKYTEKALDLKTLAGVARAYGGMSVKIINTVAKAHFHWDGRGFDGACQFAKALHALGYDVNIIHEQSGSMTTVEWR